MIACVVSASMLCCSGCVAPYLSSYTFIVWLSLAAATMIVFDNAKVFTVALLLTLFTVVEAKGAAKYCAPTEHNLAALFIW
jgi:hypothetical protein